MADQPPDPIHNGDRKRTGRRRFLAHLGAAGLAVAAAAFARPDAAHAATCGCCSLKNCPPNITYANCLKVATYTWRCYTNTNQCQCCETSGNMFSAFACWPR